MVTLVRDHGLQYLFAATLLTGAIQIIAGWARLGYVMRFIPRSVMVGFVNALAILIFSAQLPLFRGASWQMYAMVAAGLAIIYLFPRITRAIPSPLVAILVLSTIAIAFPQRCADGGADGRATEQPPRVRPAAGAVQRRDVPDHPPPIR